MQYTISDKVAEIFDLYTQLHDIRISLFSPEGLLIYPDVVGRPNCRYCMLLRESLHMDSRCRALDHRMMQVALTRRDMVSYTCHAGMREAAAPIFLEDELAGYVMLGQFRSEAAPRQSPYAAFGRREMGHDRIQEAYAATAVFPEEKIQTLLSMFRHLLEFIIGGQLIHHKDYDLILPVIQQIHGRPEQDISLAQAARLVGRSPSTVTRLFRKVTGLSYKQYQLNFRIEHAAAQLRNMPTRPVAEIARNVGYDDPLYFSRIFSKHMGCSPSRYRQSEHVD